MLARVLSAAVNGIEAFPVEVEVNSGWGDTTVVLIMSISPTLEFWFLLAKPSLSSAKSEDCHQPER
jgi:hypothetical protein